MPEAARGFGIHQAAQRGPRLLVRSVGVVLREVDRLLVLPINHTLVGGYPLGDGLGCRAPDFFFFLAETYTKYIPPLSLAVGLLRLVCLAVVLGVTCGVGGCK